MSMHNASNELLDKDLPALMLPDDAHGFVDINILDKIHECLSDSGLEEDVQLADWVLRNYLSEHLDRKHNTINTTEEFAQLDRAYRRVRSLTNKAQDKWPFFDKNWKEMSSVTVRNNARGEVAPGIVYKSTPGLYTESEVSPSSARFAAKVSQILQPQAPPSVKDTSRTPNPESNTPPSATTSRERSSFELLSVRSLSHVDDVETLESENTASPLPNKSTPSRFACPKSISRRLPEASLDPTQSEINLQLDGEQPNGFKGRSLKGRPGPLNKFSRKMFDGLVVLKLASSTLAAMRDKPKSDSQRRKSTPARANALQLTESDLQQADGAPLAITSTHHERHDSAMTGKSGLTPERNRYSVNPSGASDASEDQDVLSSPVLAAEAETVASNLDRFPPGSRRLGKQNSEPAPIMRRRGRHGGLVGRPRRLDVEPNSLQNEAEATHREHVDSPKPDEIQLAEEDDSSRMVTRRMKRRYDVPSQDPPKVNEVDRTTISHKKHGKPKEYKPEKEIGTDTTDIELGTSSQDEELIANEAGLRARNQLERIQNPTFSDIFSPAVWPDVAGMIDGTEENSTRRKSNQKKRKAGPEESASAPSAKRRARLREKGEMLKLAMESPCAHQRPASHATKRTPKGKAKAAVLHLSAQEKLPATNSTVRDAAEHTPGHVEYYARVHTFTSTVEIPLEAEKIKVAENDLLQQYAEWMGMADSQHIPYTQFRSIVGFAMRK